MKIDFNQIMLIILLGLLFLVAIVSCRSTKKTTDKIRVNDTLLQKTFETKSEPIMTSYDFKLDIDKETMKFKPINIFESSGVNSASVRLKDQRLNIDLVTGASQIKVDTIYKTKYVDKIKTSEVVKFRTPSWMWIALIALAVITVLLFVILIKY